MLWVLKKLSTDEVLQGPELLPENWGPIFGLHGVKDRLHDLSWVNIDDQGWFEVPEEPVLDPEEPPSEEEIRATRNKLLKDSDWTVMPDVPITASEYDQWIEYRKKLRDVTLQPGFPSDVIWPRLPGTY